ATALGWAEGHGQRHVGRLGGEAGGEDAAVQLGLAAFARLADTRLEAVDGLAEGLALVARQRAQLRHQLGYAALLAERGDAYALDGGEIRGGRDLGGECALQRGEVDGLGHAATAISTSSPRRRGPMSH